jgi:tetratricopeptide (TPR) repeat protein
MYNIIPLLLILASLSIIIMIIVRKFPVLANLDVENIQSEKEAKVKEQIISNRLKRNLIKWNSKIMKVVNFIKNKGGFLFNLINNKLYEMKKDYQKEVEQDEVIDGSQIDSIFIDVEELIKREEYDEAEKILIELIGKDSKNFKAFIMLAEVYSELKNHNEAKQTYEHALRLIQNKEMFSEEAEIYLNLALNEKQTDRMPAAQDYIKKALKLQPNNPRYLDTMLEISIINKEKALALEAYEKLKEVNPENQKLAEIKAQIDEF